MHDLLGVVIFCGMADLSTGLRCLPATGNAQKMLAWTLTDLSPGMYYWSVQAVDPVFTGRIGRRRTT